MDVLFKEHDNLGVITLNRPQALNALSFDMFRLIEAKLKDWQVKDSIHAIIIEAKPSKVFCAGGDVRWIYDQGQGNPEAAMSFFKTEYGVDYLTSTIGKPYIALMDGITIGGGVGVTLHGTHRVATEHFAFCMPETSIGFFPDIGASHLLASCPGGIGAYLGLTGRRLSPFDAKRLGLVDYTVSASRLGAIKAALCDADLSHDADQVITNILGNFDKAMPSDKDISHQKDLAQCFEDKKSMSDIFVSLKDIDNDWANGVLSELESLSPISLLITLESLKRAQGLDLKACLEMDYQLTYHFMQDSDFYEGVRARLVDKDKSPNWQHSSVESVSMDIVQRYFDEEPQGVPPLW